MSLDRGVVAGLDEQFVKRLHAAALRARASGFDGVADAIEAILKKELEITKDDGSDPPYSGPDVSDASDVDRR